MALSASDARLALVAVTTAGVAEAEALLARFDGSPEQVRAALFETVPEVIGYYSLGSSALAVDWYDDLREEAGASGRFTSEPVIPDRTEKVRNMLGWATQPLFEGVGAEALGAVSLRLLPSVQAEIALPNRATLVTNVRRDPDANGWQRVTSGGCRFCRLLAGRGAVYKADTARFASHQNCNCTAQPVFRGQPGEEASVLQYVASKATRTPAQRKALKDALRVMDDMPTSVTGKATGVAAKVKPSSAFESMTRDQVQKQLDITRGLKDSEWRTAQLARLEDRLRALR